MKKSLVVLVLAILGFTGNLNAQSQSKYQALFIYNFTRYIEWPSSGTQEFVIGVIGKSGIYNELLGVAEGKRVGNKSIKVKKFNSADEIGTCNILFVSNEVSSSLATFATTVQSKNTLIITERPGLINKGAGINFVLDDGKQKFELSKSSINRAGLKVNAQLVEMALLAD
jgi:hypothetical protein